MSILSIRESGMLQMTTKLKTYIREIGYASAQFLHGCHAPCLQPVRLISEKTIRLRVESRTPEKRPSTIRGGRGGGGYSTVALSHLPPADRFRAQSQHYLSDCTKFTR